MIEEMIKALERLTAAAERREYTMGDVCGLLAVKDELEAAAKNARAVLERAKALWL